MEPIRVLIVDMPGILHDIVHDALEGARDIVVVGDLSDAAHPLEAEIERANASVVVLGSGHSAAADGAPLLVRRASVKLLALAPDGAQTTLYELLPHSTALGELSPSALVSAIRSAGAVA